MIPCHFTYWVDFKTGYYRFLEHLYVTYVTIKISRSELTYSPGHFYSIHIDIYLTIYWNLHNCVEPSDQRGRSTNSDFGPVTDQIYEATEEKTMDNRGNE